TIHVARNGAWLLFLLAYPAARSLPLRAPKAGFLVLGAIVFLAGALFGLVRGPVDPGSRALAKVAARTGEPVLASALLGQQVVADGGRVWVSNPIDAFRQDDQELYLDWVSGKAGGRAAVSHVSLVLVTADSDAGKIAARDRRLAFVVERGGAVLYRVRPTG
ncbi:MAG TPA: hypothetical protein VG265_15365, partial [Gaiellaceae bacterium]|nr:hypothetical protein [Gaiellaceae bacterium]